MPSTRLFVVTTTIYAPTPTIDAFCDLLGDRLIVVGDRKTPSDWCRPPADYLNPADQQEMQSLLAASLPWNHYARKVLGYLRGVKRGADIIFDVDDDNLPKAGWDVPAFDGTYSVTPANRGFINMYASFAAQRIWPRGFPLEAIRRADANVADADLAMRSTRVGVWQALADGEPDVDAIYRLTNGTACVFGRRAPIVLDTGSACPFNSQATAFHRELFPLLYLPSTVTFRFTDILRGLVAQPIMWAAGFRLGFTEATVVQDRHPHNALDDFASEIPCYLHAQTVLDVVAGIVRPDTSIADNLIHTYGALAQRGLVADVEVERVSLWLQDLAAAAPARSH